MRVAVLFVVLTVVLLLPVQAALAEEPPEFQLGFKVLAGLISDVVGEPLENEHFEVASGNSLQLTTGGLMVWRKVDNWTAFTNGWRTWINGPGGLVERGNDERFDWESDPVSGPVPLEEASDSPTGGPDATYAELPAPDATPVSSSPLQHGEQPLDASAVTPSATPAEATTPVPPVLTATSAPSPEATPPPTMTPVPPTPTRTARPPATPTPDTGGIKSSEPAGEWVTSVHSSTKYYTHRDDRSRWQDWAAENRIWFNAEAALLAAYPGRTRADVSPTATPRLAPTATRTAPTATPVRTPTLAMGGIRSSEPAGEWVTSVASNTRYYTTRDKESVWGEWASANRIWFQTEAALLAIYPDRTRR